jgi:uncharacterized protein YlxP (DUF503 family)
MASTMGSMASAIFVEDCGALRAVKNKRRVLRRMLRRYHFL